MDEYKTLSLKQGYEKKKKYKNKIVLKKSCLNAWSNGQQANLEHCVSFFSGPVPD